MSDIDNSNRPKNMQLVGLWLLFLCLMGYWLFGTSPDTLGPQMITVFFISCFVFMALSIHILVRVLSRSFTKNNKTFSSRWTTQNTLISAALPVTLLALNTLGGLVLRDVLIVVVLLILVKFYFGRITSN